MEAGAPSGGMLSGAPAATEALKRRVRYDLNASGMYAQMREDLRAAALHVVREVSSAGGGAPTCLHYLTWCTHPVAALRAVPR